MAKSLGPKPANQGSAGKAYVQPVRTNSTPTPKTPGKTTIKFSAQPGGTHGSGKSF